MARSGRLWPGRLEQMTPQLIGAAKEKLRQAEMKAALAVRLEGKVSRARRSVYGAKSWVDIFQPVEAARWRIR